MTRTKRLLIFFAALFFLLPLLSLAQDTNKEDIFNARVTAILEYHKNIRDNGSVSIQQKLKLIGLDGAWKNKEIIFDGTLYDSLSSSEYHLGDKVLVSHGQNESGVDTFYILDYVRHPVLYWLALLFAVIVIVIGRLKGLRALIVLFLTFLIILKFIIPFIVAGQDPLFISIVGSLIILVLAICITEGFTKFSLIAIVSIIISLFITGFLSMWFTSLTKLSGFVSEEASFLVSLSDVSINIKGLFLAGIIIGALGVLDDIVISQISLVQELKLTNPEMSKRRLYITAMKVGVSHISSVINTLFLAYAGASFPLLILFSLKKPPFLNFNQVINNEIVAAEIVRTLVGSIGLVLAVPVATFLAVWFMKKVVKTSQTDHSTHHH